MDKNKKKIADSKDLLMSSLSKFYNTKNNIYFTGIGKSIFEPIILSKKVDVVIMKNVPEKNKK